jgi:hypothetical protein
MNTNKPYRPANVATALSMLSETSSEARIPVPMAWDLALYVKRLEDAASAAPALEERATDGAALPDATHKTGCGLFIGNRPASGIPTCTSRVKGLVMADGSPLLDYLNVGDDSPETDEWTKGFHEARRRLYRILAPQIAAGVRASVTDQPKGGA